MSAISRQPVLEVNGLTTRFHTQDGTVHAVNGVGFELHAGELLGVVGESGSGKSVTMMSLLRLIPIPPGEIVGGTAMFDEKDLLKLDLGELRKVRGGKIGFIFQDPMTSLNPVLTLGRQITESLEVHTDMDKHEVQAQRGRTSRDGRHSRRGTATQGIPARTLRRYAPAGHDRHRTGLLSQGHHR